MADTGTLLNASSITSDPIGRPKGVYCFAANGTFGGATVTLEMLGPDGVNYITVTGTALTAAGAVNVELPAGRYRAAVSGGVGASLHATLKEAGWQGA